ncbi:hypothetical protein BCY91_02615 [Pelobium manganitolerans]|uniref:histidine kinase n=1 Tax=Pelobium manganitolerans TaxID=1842495 RepID=A0A419S736_9SPHI|nr:tetratricopeptide repeat protein [Pelobium manganitolerans]RKD17059.1 hypothetical protein BCY91_02615 [Pelobium manganitolerans]
MKLSRIYLFLPLLILITAASATELDSLKKLLAVSKSKSQKINAWNKLGQYYARNGQPKQAISTYNHVLKAGSNSPYLLSQTYNEIGNARADLGHNAEAIKFYQKALDFMPDTAFSLRAKVNKNIGAVFLSLGKFAEALKYDNIAETYAIKAKDERTLADLANNKGAALEQLMQFDAAKHNYLKALKFYTENNINDRVCLTYNNLAILAKVQKKPAEAILYYRLAVSYAEKAKNKWLSAAIGNNLGNLLSEMGNYAPADKELQKALLLEKEIDAGELIHETLENLSENEKRRGNYEKALAYLKEGAKAKDQYLNLANTKELARLREEFDAKNRDRKIQLLSQENKIQQLRLHERNLTIISVIAAFVALGVIASLAFSRYRLRQATKIKLATAETRHQIQEEKLRISRELHDNIGAQLTFVNSNIQNLALRQAENDTLQQTKQMLQHTIKELRSTVWLINKQEFALEEFVVKLREYLKPYHGSKPNIDISLQTDQDYALEAFVASNLFRMVQELINNAMKHAEAQEIHIEITGKHRFININVSDDGKGFDLNDKWGGYGLKNLQARAESIKGRLTMHSEAGKGARFNIAFSV